jgi:transposase-like protein/IS1 family transposase
MDIFSCPDLLTLWISIGYISLTVSETPSTPAAIPACRTCGGPTIGWGKDKDGNPRRKCRACNKTFGIIPERPLGSMRLDLDKAVLCLSLLTEGSSIRSTERVSGVHRDTICRLLRKAGAKCEALLNRVVRRVEAKDVQCDELWSVVAMKERTKVRKQITDPEIGDAYTFLGIERTSKLLLAHHVGRRTAQDANIFAAKLAAAVSTDGDRPQVSTDGFEPYVGALERHFGGSIDYAQIIKSFSGEGLDSERRYSPPSIIGMEKRVIWGAPQEERVCTSHVERVNLHVRMMSRRFTRLTNAFSKKRDALRAAVALFAASYNFTWMHSSIRMTPAMKAGLARKPWTVRDLLTA